ncbi:MAG TPA: UDP-N-acetylmuramate--L-alanine ligase [Polyangia bacterium]|jgi:UDP-N-acetylmuramate--alanine ligase|nr:UDP-N-acetylmuramate--L-alanine ligase [Polyangia bacterium]
MFRKRNVSIHFVGIGGIGMSGIAEVLLNLGYAVSGSDLKPSDVTARLTTLGARIAFGHSAENLAHTDVVVVSSAVRADNPEVISARARDIPVIPRAEMLGELMRVKDGVAVAGSHGKTTTTTMIASVLAQAGLDPTAIIGGKARAFGSNARLGQGELLVAEADESDGSFRHLFPQIAVVTNIDREHMDHYGNLATLRAAFLDFANKVPFFGLVVLGADDPMSASLAPDLLKRHLTYGLHAGDYRGQVLDAGAEGTRLRIAVRGKDRGEVRVRMPGVHYAENALAVLCVADFLGVSFADYAEALGTFQGVDRRFSVRGEAGGVLVVDDYGHHPTEIAATVAAARLYGRRLVVAFQPHRYSRTRDLFADFAPALAGADVVVLTDIYPAGESPLEGVNAAGLAATFAPTCQVHHVPRAELVSRLGGVVRSGDLVLVLGAGDITHAATELLARLGKPPTPGRAR